jgi:hypothetical protein
MIYSNDFQIHLHLGKSKNSQHIMEKYLFALAILTLSFSARSQFSTSEIWAKGQWMHVSATAKNNFLIDANNIKFVGDEIYTYMAIIDVEKNQYSGPFEFILNCQSKSYKLGATTTPQWSPTTAGGIAANKLCGDIHRDNGDKYEFLGSFMQKETKVWTDHYWVPKDIYRDAKAPDVFIVKYFYSDSPPPLNFNTTLGALAEVDCRNSKLRLSFGTPGKLTIDTSKDWGPLNQGNPMYTKTCLNKEIVIKEFPMSKSPQMESIGIDSAKSKCIDLGFKTGTEAFGKCVLQLSK